MRAPSNLCPSTSISVSSKNSSTSPPCSHRPDLACWLAQSTQSALIGCNARRLSLVWLRSQTKESLLALHPINADWVDWASQQAKSGRWLQGGEVELFFDDTEIEVEGHKFEGARINYEGNRALSRSEERRVGKESRSRLSPF